MTDDRDRTGRRPKIIGDDGRFERPATGPDLESRIDAVETAIVDIRGESGSNGKLGALKARVDTAEARRWWAVTALAGLVVTVITASIAFGRWMSRVETDVDWLKQRSRGSAHEERKP